jgi:hypothetical protein
MCVKTAAPVQTMACDAWLQNHVMFVRSVLAHVCRLQLVGCEGDTEQSHPTCSKAHIVQAWHPGTCGCQINLSVVCLQLQLSV